MFVVFVQVSQVGWSIIPYLFNWGVGRKEQCQKFFSKAVDDNGDVLDV